MLDGKILVNVGGKGAGLVAVDAKTGKTVWQATSEVGSYSAPTSIEWKETLRPVCDTAELRGGRSQGRKSFGDGTLWTAWANGECCHSAGDWDEVFLSASYGIGAKLLSTKGGELNRHGATTSRYRQYATAVAKDDVLFGSHGREDAGARGTAVCERATGKVSWSKNFTTDLPCGSGARQAACAGDRWTLRVIEASKTKYTEVADAELTTST
ncbi:MAG: hypothetical protein U0894_08775 [Pirellulales bacterium]